MQSSSPQCCWAGSQGCQPLTLHQSGGDACTNCASLQDLPRDCYSWGPAFEFLASFSFGKGLSEQVLEHLKAAEGVQGVARTAPTWADVCARTQRVHSCMLTRAINTLGPSQLQCHVPEPGRRVCEDEHSQLGSPAQPPVPPITPSPGPQPNWFIFLCHPGAKRLGSWSRGCKQSMESPGAATTPRRSSRNPSPGDGEHLLRSLWWHRTELLPLQSCSTSCCLLHCMEVATDGNFHALQSTTSG